VPALGRRGGGWVALQLVLVAAIVAACVLGPRWGDAARGPLLVAGLVLAVAGAAAVAAAARALGPALTPFPRPSQAGRLVASGPYRLVRHPLYAGGLLLLGGLSLAFSPLALGATAVLAVVWALKLTVEERFLRATYPDYEAYCASTRHRLVPFVF